MSHLGRPKGDGPRARALARSRCREARRALRSATSPSSPTPTARLPLTLSPRSSRATSSCSRTSASTSARRRTTPRSPRSSPTYGDVFVLDAFGTAHRAQGSVVGPAQYLPAVAGFLLEKEVDDPHRPSSAEPERPFVAILGGSKVSDKIGVIDRLLDSADTAHHRRRHGLHLLPTLRAGTIGNSLVRGRLGASRAARDARRRLRRTA